MRICRTTLWIKKSALFFKALSLTTFGPFGAERGRTDRESAAKCAFFVKTPWRAILPRHAVHMSGDGPSSTGGQAPERITLRQPFNGVFRGYSANRRTQVAHETTFAHLPFMRACLPRQERTH